MYTPPLRSAVLLSLLPLFAALPLQERDNPDTDYDFIVIGAGTAGLPVAARLSETNASVLVLEAGGKPEDSGLPYRIPGQTGKLVGSPLDWNFTSVPEYYMNNRSIILNRGKALGGSSAINGMTYGRGSASVLDHWAAMGNPGWSWSEVLPYYEKSFLFTSPPDTTAYRLHDPVLYPATAGPGKLGFNNFNPTVVSTFVDAAAALNVGVTQDVNGGNQTGAQHEISTFDSQSQLRVSSYDSFYQEAAQRSNFHAITYAHVEKILISNETGVPTAVGVKYSKYDKNGEKKFHTVTANKEVILSAGVFQSPQLLMLSGVGPSETLEKHGIPVIVDNENVGVGMQDQPWTSLIVRSEQDQSTSRLFYPNLYPEYAANAERQWNESRSGPWDSISGTTGPTHLFLSYTEEELRAANATHLLSTNRTTQSHLEIILFTHPYPNVSTPYYPIDPKVNYFSLTGWILAPASRGYVTIQSADSQDPPVICQNTLKEQTDVAMSILAIKKMRKMLAHPGLSQFTIGPNNGEVIPGEQGQTDKELEEYFRAQMTSAAHQIGSLAMRPKEDQGVVDPRLRVYGVKNLRVADVSICPVMIDNHPSAIAYMIGEKAADLIKEDWNL